MRRTEDRRQRAGVRSQKSGDRSQETGVRGVLRPSLVAPRSPPFPHPSSLIPHPSGSRGVALVLTLGILALVMLLLIAFVTSMRVENMAAKNFNDVIKARQLAQAAVDDAVGQLRFATPSPTPNGTWVAIPGAIINNPTPSGSITTNYLYTTPNPPGNYLLPDSLPNAGTVDLNAGLLITGSNSFYNTLFNPLFPGVYANASITAGWVNVTANIGGVLMLQGRFAYWVDVESGKVNINYASQRKASNPALLTDPLMNQSIPDDVDLRALEPPFLESLVPNFYLNFTNAHANPLLGQPLFSTVEEMRRGLLWPNTLDDGQGGYLSNKFFVTVGTIDTNTDAFGRDRIDLRQITSDSAAAFVLAQGTFQDSTWGTLLYPTIVNANRNSLAKKYGTFGMNQILANIAEYQRAYTAIPPFGNASLDGNSLPASYSGLKMGALNRRSHRPRCDQCSVGHRRATNANQSPSPCVRGCEARKWLQYHP